MFHKLDNIYKNLYKQKQLRIFFNQKYNIIFNINNLNKEMYNELKLDLKKQHLNSILISKKDLFLYFKNTPYLFLNNLSGQFLIIYTKNDFNKNYISFLKYIFVIAQKYKFLLFGGFIYNKFYTFESFYYLENLLKIKSFLNNELLLIYLKYIQYILNIRFVLSYLKSYTKNGYIKSIN